MFGRMMVGAVVVAALSSAAVPTSAALVGQSVQMDVTLTGGWLFENPQPTFPQSATVISPAAEFAFQVDDVLTQDDGSSGVSVEVNVEENYVDIVLSGSIVGVNPGDTFTMLLTFPGLIQGAAISTITPLSIGSMTLGAVGPGTVSIVGTTSDSGEYDAVGGSQFRVNFQFVQIPEPATASLGLLSLGGLMLRRRRVA